MSGTVIKARGVEFSHESKQVLRGVDLDLAPGELCCLMGANGCGKSTFLDCVLGVNSPSNGSILVEGSPVSTYSAKHLALRLSYVPQVHKRSFPYLAEHVVLMGRTAHRSGFSTPDDVDLEIAREALAVCGVGHLGQRPYTQLSGGETQMVMLARALAQQTPIILMDEPTAHLDFRNELLFMETVVRLVREKGVSVLMATHSPNQPFYFENAGIDVCVAMMHAGRIHSTGRPTDVLGAGLFQGLYGIEVAVLEGAVADGPPIRQVVPLRTSSELQGVRV
jgi:iron complex transport system ATP-binding protein